MKRSGEMMLLLLALLVLGAVAVWAAFFRKTKSLQSLSTDKTIAPPHPGAGGCSPDFVNAQANALMNSTAGGATSGAAAGPGAAGASAAISGAPALLGVLAGPCGPNIEKKLKELAASLDPHIGERANAVLRNLDRQRLNATRPITTPIVHAANAAKATVKAATRPVSTAKNVAKKVGIKF